MKLRYILLAALSAILLPVVSCTKEISAVEKGEEVTILISTGDQQKQTRAPINPTEPGFDPDFRIGTLRVLIYHESSGLLYINSGKFTPPNNPQSITLMTGRYHFVFIANEELDGTLSSALDGLTAGSPFSEITALEIDESAFDSMIMTGTPETEEKDTFIPKVAVKGDVLVSKREGKTTIVESDGTTIDNSTDDWKVPLTQTGIRIDLSLELTDPQMALYEDNKLTLSLSNVPDHVDLLGKYNYTGAAQTMTRTLGSGTVSGNTVTWERIVLPETFFPDKTNKDNGIVLTATLDGMPYKATLGYELAGDPKDYTIRRGTWLIIESATIAQAQEIVLNNVTVQDWDPVSGGDVELEEEEVNEE